MASQTQKQKTAAAKAAAKAAEEAKAAAAEAALKEQQEEETQPDPADQDKVSETEIQTQPHIGLDNLEPAPDLNADVKEAVASENEEVKTESQETKPVEKVAEQPKASVLEAKSEGVGVANPAEEKAETPKETPAPTVAKSRPAMKRVEVKDDNVNIDTISTEDYFQMKHQYVIGSGSKDLVEILEFLDRYEETMARGKVVDERIGASLQHQLFRTYLRALSLSVKERNIAMDYILWKFFKNEKSAYRPHAVVRFTRSGKWDTSELTMFTTLNTIFQAISHPSERVLVLREYKLGAMVAKFPEDKARYTESFLSWTQTYR